MRKRCWKTVLSAILASAMLFTSVPSNLTMTVHAEELGMEDTLVDVNETEDEDEQETEDQADDQTGEQAGNEADESQDVQNPVGGGINIVDPADDGDGNDVTDDSDEAADSETTASSNENVELHADEAEVGADQDGLQITFSCKPVDGFFGSWDETSKKDVPIQLSKIDSVIVRGLKVPGGGDNDWGDLVTLTKGANGVYTGTWTAPSYGRYEYTFKANNGYYMLYNNKANLRITLIDPDGEYAGPTIDYDTTSDDPGAVTFYFPQTFKGEEVKSVKVKGSWDDNWADMISLDDKVDDLWATTLKPEKLPRDKSVEYGFDVNADNVWSVDEANPNDGGNGNSKLHRNPVIDTSNNDVTLYYYPSHGKYPKTVKVNYRKGDTGDYTEVEMARDSVEKAVYSVKLTGLEEAEYEYYFDVDGTRVEDTNNAETGKIILVNYPEKDESVTSPEIKDGKVTFNYYGPGQKSVQLAGIKNNWSGVDMTYDPATAYWSITLDLGAGFHQYKFISSKEGWIADPLHSEPEQLFGNGKNSYFVIAGLENAEASVGVGDSTELPATLPLWKGDETTDKPANDAIKAVTYALSAETNTKEYKDKITLNPETKDGVTTTTVSVAEDFPRDVTDFTLTASDGANHTSTVTVTVIGAVSPQIDGKTVTFIFDDSVIKGDVTAVYVAGTMNNWQDTIKSDEYKLAKNEDTGYWELTTEMSAGSYQYKYIYYLEGDDEEDYRWAKDPWNPNDTGGDDPNSKFIITGLADRDVFLNREIAKAELDSKLDLFDETGDSKKVDVTYELSEDTKAAEYKDAVEVTTEDGKPCVKITDEFPKTVKEFTLTAKDENDKTSKVTVSIVDKTYEYTFFYYDRYPSHMDIEATDLWIWENNGAAGAQFIYDEKVTMKDGSEWLKATVVVPYTDMGIIGRSYDSWTWKDEDRSYKNTEEKPKVTLYYVFGRDITEEYPTELPELVKEPDPRFLVVEYTREAGTNGWYFYTWNNGRIDKDYIEEQDKDGNPFIPFKDEDSDGTGTAIVPIGSWNESVTFCIEQKADGKHWADKDGGDHVCVLPLDQTVVKVKMVEGQGITYVYPYNTGYEIDVPEEKIHFYYRDDEAFLKGSESGHASAQLEIRVRDEEGALGEAETKNMVYDEGDADGDPEQQRYEYDVENLQTATYYYRYALKDDEGATTYVLDKFNEETETIDDIEYSVCKYVLFDAELQASLQNDSMDYNDNNVLTLTVKAKDSEPAQQADEAQAEENKLPEGFEVSKAYVDLSAIGGSSEAEIDPELLQLSIAVKSSIGTGTKTLPVTLYDQYNNVYATETSVNVVPRTNSSHISNDFDWDEAVIYFAVTDRFFDGNTANNNGNAPGSYDKTTNNGSNSSYHGGDFEGLTQKLDYLQDLGVNTIWITPIVENQTISNDCTADDAGKENKGVTQAWGYHGYWAKDFEKLDSHLGTEDDFSALLNAAHAKGMKVMVDVVLNHSGYGDDVTSYFDSTFKNEDGKIIRMLRNADETVGGSDQKAPLAGLPDFRTEDPEVRNLLVEWQSNWISKYPIDYYRVDTVKHVDNTTWSAFKNALTEINPDFKMIGEWSGAGYGTDTGLLNSGRMDSLLDFDFNDQAATFVTGNLSSVENFLSARNGAIDNTASLGAFLSSHDEDGFVYKLMNPEKGVGKSEEEARNLALVAASLQLTAKGQVVIYYGEEIGVSDGQENYPYNTNRNDFDWSKVTDDNKTLAHYKKMLSIRNMYSDLFAKGTRNTVSADNANGLDVFERSYGGTTLTVALNITNQEQTYTLSGQTPGKVMLDYYSGALFPIDENGNAVITVPAAADGGTVVLVQDEELENHPEGMQIRKIPDQTYTGLSIKLSEDVLQVYAGTNRLKAGVDYTVSYKNNKAIGTATVTIKGKGNYKDSVTAQFNIVPKNIAADDVVITYNEYVKAGDKEQKPLSKITYNGKKLTTKEYQVKYYKKNDSTPLSGVKEVGEYQMEITATGKNYTGVAKKAIHVVEGKFMNELKIEFSTSVDYAKTSKDLEDELGVVVKDGTVELTKGTDYEVSFPDGIEVGTAKITITAINKGADQKYYGSVTKTFKINGEPLNSVAKVNPTGWVNVAIDPASGKAEQAAGVAVLVKKNNNSPELTLGDDYTVSYSNNTKPGTATVTFTGKGKYTGTLKKTFKVTAIAWKADDLGKDLTVTVNPTAPFSKKGAQPAVTVTYSGKKLTAGKDYKVTYNNNKVITPASATANKKPSVTITGMGMFSGTVKNAAEFTVVKANLETDGITVTAPDVEQASGYETKPVVKAADGTYLIKDTDYTVEYHELDKNGEPKDIGTGFEASTTTRMQVTVTGKGNYEGSVPKEYRIVGTSISKATIIAKAQTYTGKEIILDKNDFSKARIGKTPLTYGTDYVIVPGSYEKNVNKGNATVTVKGIGNYGGEKKITFRITSSGMRWWWNLFS